MTWDARIDAATTGADIADIAVTALDRWFAADNGFGPLRGSVDMSGILAHVAANPNDGCADCADTDDYMCGGCRAEGIALGAGGR